MTLVVKVVDRFLVTSRESTPVEAMAEALLKSHADSRLIYSHYSRELLLGAGADGVGRARLTALNGFKYSTSATPLSPDLPGQSMIAAGVGIICRRLN